MKIHLHIVLADMDIEPHPSKPEWASWEECWERGGGSLRLPCKRIRPSGSRLKQVCRRKTESTPVLCSCSLQRSLKTTAALDFEKVFSDHYATLYPLHQLRELQSEEEGLLLFACRTFSPNEEQKSFERPIHYLPEKLIHPGLPALYDASHACFGMDFQRSGAITHF